MLFNDILRLVTGNHEKALGTKADKQSVATPEVKRWVDLYLNKSERFLGTLKNDKLGESRRINVQALRKYLEEEEKKSSSVQENFVT